MNRQLQLDLEEDGARAPTYVSAEVQRSVVELMAAAIIAVLGPEGEEHDEQSDIERED
jgi:hypothetical protein